MRVGLSKKRTRRAAERARQLAVLFGRKRHWKSSDDIEAISDTGLVGLRPLHKYLSYLNTGTQPRDMVELEGKTIPMKDEDGTTRFVRVKGVGKPGYVTMPGGVKVWKERRWHHPGIKATHFMDDAVDQAVREEIQRPGLFKVVRRALRG